jgi:hypothetical protein
VIDLDALSADGDMRKLTGQIIGILAGISIIFAAPLLLMRGPLPPPVAWSAEHFFLSTTMAVVGVLSVLSWNSVLPDRKDLLVLLPLPVPTRTIFAAKGAALASVLSSSLIALNWISGLTWPLLFSPPRSSLFGSLWSVAAWWITLALAAVFIFSCALCAQACAALLLPRQLFLRISALLQVTAFVTILGTWVLEPSLATVPALEASQNQRLLAWLPSYWFLGVFQQLNRSMQPAFAPLARRAWTGMAIGAACGVLLPLLAWMLRMRKVIEQPDILPVRRGRQSAIHFKSSLHNAVVRFSLRCLIRSQQHRILYAFYLSAGLVAAALYIRGPHVRAELAHHSAALPAPLLTATLMVLCLSIFAVRLVTGIPVALAANWVFQMTQLHTPASYQRAARATLSALSLIPVTVAIAIVIFTVVPGWSGAVHVAALSLFGMMLIEMAILTLNKLPFVCSYLPGRAQLHVLFWAGVFVCIPIAEALGRFESRLLATLPGRISLLSFLALGAALMRLATRMETSMSRLVFEEREEEVITSLNLGT